MHPARGTIFPQPLLLQSNGATVRMDDVHPAGWKIVFSANASDEFAQAAKHHHLPALLSLKLGTAALTEAEGVLQQWFDKHGVQAAIVRPDHYIYGVCQTPQDVSHQLNLLTLV